MMQVLSYRELCPLPEEGLDRLRLDVRARLCSGEAAYLARLIGMLSIQAFGGQLLNAGGQTGQAGYIHTALLWCGIVPVM